MAEATHDDIITRVREVERRQARSEDQISELSSRQRSTHEELIAHRAEFRGLATGIKFGLAVLTFVVTCGLAILGMMVSA